MQLKLFHQTTGELHHCELLLVFSAHHFAGYYPKVVPLLKEISLVNNRLHILHQIRKAVQTRSQDGI